MTTVPCGTGEVQNRTWNKCGPERANHYSSAGLCGLDGLYVQCGAVRALKIMLRGGCGPPQDNEVRCGAGAGLACAGRCGCGPGISARADL